MLHGGFPTTYSQCMVFKMVSTFYESFSRRILNYNFANICKITTSFFNKLVLAWGRREATSSIVSQWLRPMIWRSILKYLKLIFNNWQIWKYRHWFGTDLIVKDDLYGLVLWARRLLEDNVPNKSKKRSFKKTNCDDVSAKRN